MRFGSYGRQKPDDLCTHAMALQEPIEWPPNAGDLLGVLRPHVYASNPFRTLGLDPVVATGEIDRRCRAIKVGVISETRDPLVGLYHAPSLQGVDVATRNLYDPVNRFFAWVFWFWVRKSDVQSDLIALHDATIMNHAIALAPYAEDSAAKQGYPSLPREIFLWDDVMDGWQHLLSRREFSEELCRRARELDDPRLSDQTVASIVSALPATLLRLNGELAGKAIRSGDHKRAAMHAGIVKSFFCESDQKAAAEATVAGTRSQLRQMVVDAEKDSRGPADFIRVCGDLLQLAEQPLQILDLLLSENHPAVELHHDSIALKALDMLVSYLNNGGNWWQAPAILHKVQKVSRGKQAKERIGKNRDIIRKYLGTS